MRIFGLAVGIASVGWSVLEVLSAKESDEMKGRIIAAGTSMFDPSEQRGPG